MRKIIHIDMDAFYAAVEQRDNPQLRGKPVVVGGPPDSRGVVASCSYEARRYGIHSAMASSAAYRLCRSAVFVRGRFNVYGEVSAQLRSIFNDYSELVEPLSLDEAYIDVTGSAAFQSSATRIAQDIRRRIHRETGLTASAGVSYNKFIAKVASDFNKPDGMTVITPAMAQGFLEALPVRKFYGVGRATEKKMLAMGVKTGADLRRLGLDVLLKFFGRSGAFYYDMVRGRDSRQVEPDHERKSIGREHTFAEDMEDRGSMLKILASIAQEVSESVKRHDAPGRTVTLKVKYSDFVSVTRSRSMPGPVSSAEDIMRFMPDLLDRTEAGRRKVRLLGISVSGLERGREDMEDRQLSLPF